MVNFFEVNFDRCSQRPGRTDEIFYGAEFDKYVAPYANISVAKFVVLVCFFFC